MRLRDKPGDGSIFDAFPQSSAIEIDWSELEPDIRAFDKGLDEARALAAFLVVLDRIGAGSDVEVSLRSGELRFAVDRGTTISNLADFVRASLEGGAAAGRSDAEIAWGGDVEVSPRVVLVAGYAGEGKCILRFRRPPLTDDGARLVARLWSAVLELPVETRIGAIDWGSVVEPSIIAASHRPARDIPSSFDDVLKQDASRVAVVDDRRAWTYGEIDGLAGSIAASLLERGVAPGEIVAIALSRSAEAIAAMLGIVKIGAAYLPLDLTDPEDRLRYVVDDAAIRFAIVDHKTTAAASALGIEAINVKGGGQASVLPPLGKIAGDALAYVMYTSGSTGKPKGVEVRHQGVTRLVLDCSFMTLDEETAMLHAAPLGFDASTLEVWGPLLNGGRVIIHGEAVPTGSGLARSIAEQGARAAWLTSALFNAVVDDDPRNLAGLDTLLIGGEALSISHVRRFLKAVPGTRLINGYGPTETTTFATTYPIDASQLDGAQSVPIGRPISATALYVLDRCGQPVPRGLVGELHIGGLGVARGYLRRPELTSQSFLPDHFANDGSRMYRTGDQVRMSADGVLEFVGRIDGQVKVRGFRIEMGEIEAALSGLPELRKCAVVARRDEVRGNELVAYVVPADETFAPAALKEKIGRLLPDYMVPTQWVRLDDLPVTANGKLDRRSLPAPHRERPDDLAHPYIEPAPGAERDVATAMARSLGIDRVGALDNFFDLGGNSLLVLRVHTALRDLWGRDLAIAHFFADPTPRRIASLVATPHPGEARQRPKEQKSDGVDVPVAIIGMAGRFPGAGDIERFWQMLCDGRDTIRFFDADELDASIPGELRRDSRYVAARGIIDDVDMFDATFFGIPPREAELMDPQHRVFLEIAWECLERAGQIPEKTTQTIGVFAGMHNATYFANHVRAHPEKVARLGEFLVMLGNEKDYIATRAAHKLGLTGPAVSVHTACSTSLVAIAQAFDAIRAGQCGLALAGGASITCPPSSGYLYQEGAMLSPDGHTRTFDADAQGTVFSDGAAVVLLKRLDDAIADGNTIHAVIRSVAVNNDGAARASFTAPSVAGQAAVIRAALARSGINARSIDYVEAHGTATPLGDPVEVAALTEAFREHTSDTGYCAIGSLKSNTGHMVIAAGASGLIKTVLSLRHEVLPPSLHFKTPNPKIDFAGSPFVVNSTLRAWPRRCEPRRAGVSSFGVGGTNAHVILEEAPQPARSLATTADGGPQLLRLSARSASALSTMCGRLADHLSCNAHTALADVAYTLDVGRRDFAHRAVVVAETIAEATAALREKSSSRSAGAVLPDAEPTPVFMLPGQGSQYAGMGRQLHEKNEIARRALDACFDALAGTVSFDLRQRMFAGDPADLKQTAVTQPATFALEYALAKIWLARGIEPAALVGHSVGEFVAATLAGVMRMEDAIRLVAKRGAIMQALPPGAMLSVRMSAAEVEPLLPQNLQLAAENGPAACVVAGPTEVIDAFSTELNERGFANRRLQTSHAFHSAMMDPALPALLDALGSIRLSAPGRRIASTLTGRWLTAEEATDPGYWARHMREPVRFSAAVGRMLDELPAPLFLEVGPGSALTSLVRLHRKSGSIPMVVASLGADPSQEVKSLAVAAGELWVKGLAPKAPPDAGEGCQRIELPTYPFERQRHWVSTARQTPVLRLATSESRPAGAPDAGRRDANDPAAATASVIGKQQSVPADLPSPPFNATSSTVMSNRHDRLVQRLRDLFEDVSGIEPDDGDPALSFVELGFDSLTLTQVALQLKNEFKLPITFRQLMEDLRSFEELARYLDAELPAEQMADPAAPDGVMPTQTPPGPAGGAAPAAANYAAQLPAVGVPAGPVTADMPLVQQVIQQQMALMAQHLALLQGHGATRVPAQSTDACAVVAPVAAMPEKPAAAPPASAPAGTPAAANDAASEESSIAHTTYDVKKAFGAIARIHTAADDMTDRQRARLDAFIRRYNEKTKKSKSYTTEHRPHLADPRVVNGFRPRLKEIIYQIVIGRSKGAKVWDIDGNEYVDALNGFGMNMFGWQPDFVLDAVRKQLEAGYEIGPQHPLAGVVAKLACELTGFDRAGLCNTGSEAVMGCVRIARTVTGRKKIAIFTGAYHGIFDEVIVRGTRKGTAVPAAPGILKNTAENVFVLDYGTPETLQWLKDHASELAAVLVEPVQSRRPDFQPREFLHELRALTKQSGALLIFDEVVTGFRSHPGGAQAVFGIRADLASYGKVVGGGFPIGIIAGKREYMDALDGGHWQFGDESIPTVGVTYFAGTFVRHPLALAAAEVVLEHLKTEGAKLQETLTGNTAAMVDELNAYCQETGAPITLKSFASVWKIFFDEDHPFQDLLFAMMRNRGVHILDNFPCFMTTAHDAAAIAVIKTAFKEAVAELQQSDFLPRRIKAPVLAFDASRPPIPGARLGRDNEGRPAWFVANPESPGKYIKVDAQ